LVHRQLMSHLGQLARPDEIQIVDIGCGQGTQALRLGRAGFRVIGVDPWPRLLADATQSLGDEPAAVRGRVTFERGDLEHLEQVGGPFDVVCCHGVLMYLASLDEALGRLVEATKLGGLVSVLTKNRASLAMRAGLRGRWHDALGAFDARRYTNSLGVEQARADDPQDVMASLGAHGADLVAWYGVRMFTDHWGDQEPPEDVEVLLAAEEEAGRRDPYRALCATTHVIACRASIRQ
jgi:S-adenosylmethionine-dependent methyltransferase